MRIKSANSLQVRMALVRHTFNHSITSPLARTQGIPGHSVCRESALECHIHQAALTKLEMKEIRDGEKKNHTMFGALGSVKFSFRSLQKPAMLSLLPQPLLFLNPSAWEERSTAHGSDSFTRNSSSLA